MSEYINTRIKGFRLKVVEKEDIEVLYQFIRAIAEYEQMLEDIHGDESVLYRSIIDGKYAKALIAYEEDVPVGFMVYYYSFSTFECRPGIHLEDLFIHKEYRGKGYGKLMLTYLANEAVKNGFTRLEWTCLNWNAPSIEFYEKLGARNMCEWRTYRLSGKELMENADFYFGHCTPFHES